VFFALLGVQKKPPRPPPYPWSKPINCVGEQLARLAAAEIADVP